MRADAARAVTWREPRAWHVISGLSLAAAIILGTTLCTMGIFLNPLTDAFHTTSAEVAQATTFFILAMTLTMATVGWLVDRLGLRTVMTTGAMVTATAYWIGAQSQDVTSYAIAMAVAGVGVGASTSVPGMIAITSWTDARRGSAMGFFMAMSALGATLFPMLVARLLAGSDWRAVMHSIAAMIALITVPVLLVFAVLRARGCDAAVHADVERGGHGFADGLRTRAFWLLATTQVLAGLGFQGVYLYIVPFLSDVGFSASQAAMMFGLCNLTTIPGFLLFGLLADRWGAKPALVAGLVTCGLSTPLLLAGQYPAVATLSVVLFAVFWGATCSLVTQLAPLLLAEAVGLRDYGSLLGASFLMYGVAMAVGSGATGRLHDATGSYVLPFLLLAGSMMAATIPLAFLRGRGR